MALNGKIIINPYLRPAQSLTQANRISEELTKLGVKVRIVTDAFLRLTLDGEVKGDLQNTDFAVYLDKDKYISEMLYKTGVRLFNSHTAIRVCDDKARTYIALSKYGFNMPKTLFAPLCYNVNDDFKSEWIENIVNGVGGYPIIVKECYGSMGKGVHKADNLEQLDRLANQLKTTPHFYQQFIKTSAGKDLRITVVGKKAISIMQRENANDFRSNVAKGGKGVKIDLTDKKYASYLQTAERIAQILDLDYCGIDLLTGENFEPVVCEVNSNAFFEETERVCGVNVAKAYAEHIVRCLK